MIREAVKQWLPVVLPVTGQVCVFDCPRQSLIATLQNQCVVDWLILKLAVKPLGEAVETFEDRVTVPVRVTDQPLPAVVQRVMGAFKALYDSWFRHSWCPRK